MNKNKKYRIAAAAVSLVLLLGMSAGVTAAYLSRSTGSVHNVITSGDISIRLQEERWNPDAALTLHPGQSLEKNPSVTNTGKNPAFVFLEVRVPVRNISAVGQDGRKTERQERALFRYEADTEGWELIDEWQEENCICTVYAYRSLLKPGESTCELFQEITVIDYLEGELDPEEYYSVDVCARAIQNQVDTEEGSLLQIYTELLNQTSADRE